MILTEEETQVLIDHHLREIHALTDYSRSVPPRTVHDASRLKDRVNDHAERVLRLTAMLESRDPDAGKIVEFCAGPLQVQMPGAPRSMTEAPLDKVMIDDRTGVLLDRKTGEPYQPV